MNSKGWATLLASVVWMASAQAGGAALGKNLLKNGGAEQGTGSASGDTIEVVPKWTAAGNFTVVQYGAPAFPDASSPGPTKRGVNFFSGGPNSAESSATTVVSLKALAGEIDLGGVQAKLVGYLGGYSSQDDRADLVVEFLDRAGAVLATLALPGVSAADRGNVTGMLKRSAGAAVPVGSRSVRATLTMTRASGSYNDGYADGLSLVLN